MKKVLVYMSVMAAVVVFLVIVVNAQNSTKGNASFKIYYPAITLSEAHIVEFIIRQALEETTLPKNVRIDVYFNSEFVGILNDEKDTKAEEK